LCGGGGTGGEAYVVRVDPSRTGGQGDRGWGGGGLLSTFGEQEYEERAKKHLRSSVAVCFTLVLAVYIDLGWS